MIGATFQVQIDEFIAILVGLAILAIWMWVIYKRLDSIGARLEELTDVLTVAEEATPTSTEK